MSPVLKVIKYGEFTNDILFIPFRQKSMEDPRYFKCAFCSQDIFYFFRDHLTNKLTTNCYFCDYNFLCVDPLESITISLSKDINSRIHEVCNTLYLYLLKHIQI